MTDPKLPTTPRAPQPLAAVLHYENPEVVYKFTSQFDLGEKAARDVFQETLRWLWLCAYARVTPGAPKQLTVIGLPQMIVIDEMWHTFALFTPHYAAFCDDYLGTFVHHSPSGQQERQAQQALRQLDPAGFEAARLESFRSQARFVGSVLGAATVRKWFTYYAEQYSPGQLDRIRIPLARAFPDQR